MTSEHISEVAFGVLTGDCLGGVKPHENVQVD